MRIRPSATRSPPCLDAGRRGFAMIGSHRERIQHQPSRATVVLRRDPSGELQAATATGLIAPGVLCVFMAGRIPGAGAEKPRSGSSRSPASVIGHCQRRFRQGDPGQSVPDLTAWTARGMPPEGPRSPRAARRGEARQAARSRSDAPETPASGNDRGPGIGETSDPDGNRTGPAPPAAGSGKMSRGKSSRPSRNSSGTARIVVRKLEGSRAASRCRRFRSRGAKRPRPAGPRRRRRRRHGSAATMRRARPMVRRMAEAGGSAGAAR